MENHPIPQDVTGFQFKLIGDMTVKQFAYLAFGVIFGWIFFSLQILGVIRFPLSLFFIGTGVSFAFLPLEGRPMDIMVTNFIKAIFAPNMYIYQKVGGTIGIFLQAPKVVPAAAHVEHNTVKLQQYLQNLPKKAKNKLDQREMVFFESLAQMSGGNGSPQKEIVVHGQQPNIGTIPHLPGTTPGDGSMLEQEENKTQKTGNPLIPHITISAEDPHPVEIKLNQQASDLQRQLEAAKILEQQQKELGGGPEAHQRVEALEQQLNQIISQKESLEKQLLELSKKFAEKQTGGQAVFTPAEGVAKQETQHVRKIPKGMGASVGLPIVPEFPNLLVGIIKDPRGNILPQILVEVRDKEGNPVRAFKTNSLGQFASATPLLNGTYTLVFEDPTGKQKFDSVEITADGAIIPPLEIISSDAREELRKELFG